MRDAGQRAARPRVHALQRVQVRSGLPLQLDRRRRGRQPARQPGEQRRAQAPSSSFTWRDTAGWVSDSADAAREIELCR